MGLRLVDRRDPLDAREIPEPLPAELQDRGGAGAAPQRRRDGRSPLRAPQGRRPRHQVADGAVGRLRGRGRQAGRGGAAEGGESDARERGRVLQGARAIRPRRRAARPRRRAPLAASHCSTPTPLSRAGRVAPQQEGEAAGRRHVLFEGRTAPRRAPPLQARLLFRVSTRLRLRRQALGRAPHRPLQPCPNGGSGAAYFPTVPQWRQRGS